MTATTYRECERRHLNPGCKLALSVFVVTQFIDYTLFDVQGIQITVQKLSAAVLLPVAILLMRHVRLSWPLFILAGWIAFAYSFSHLTKLEIGSPLLNGLFGVCIGLFASIVVYTALCSSRNTIEYFGRLWVFWSCVSSAIMAFQLFGILPLFVVPSGDLPSRVALGGLYRATGFKHDPNIAALVLVIGLAFAQVYAARRKTVTCALITIGLLTTFSRMGVIVALFLVAVAAVQAGRVNKSRLIRAVPAVLGVAVVLALLSIATLELSPDTGAYLRERFYEVAITFAKIVNGTITSGTGQSLTSSETRVLLARGALHTAKAQWYRGVGAYKTEEAIFEMASVRNVAHNTYLELLLLGGVWGLVCMLYYYSILRRSFRVSLNCKGVRKAREAVIGVSLAFAAAGLFLSITYTVVLWMPAFLALALRYHARCEKLVDTLPPEYRLLVDAT